MKAKLADCEQARQRIGELIKQRQATYKRVFEQLLQEQQILADLYAPLMQRFADSNDTLRKLSFSVQRVADIQRWASAGEDLLDLRKQGPVRGRGALYPLAEAKLRRAWETGDPEASSEAIAAFRAEHQEGLVGQAPFPKNAQREFRGWLKSFGQWLYNTDHISVRYSVDYDGVDIRKLSPGTRGIVLLLLYLALDDADDRPLIIDQPEENLDPKSIFDDLVALFIKAKEKRQVIIVTHNANLVVNTDADQVIVAEAGPRQGGGLPPITYLSGGLESKQIRDAVCKILEGGEEAFRERARRLLVRLDR